MSEILLMLLLVLFVIGASWSIIKVFKISLLMGVLNLFIWPIPFLLCLIHSFHTLRFPFFLVLGSALGIVVLFWIDPRLYQLYLQPLINAYHYLTTP